MAVAGVSVLALSAATVTDRTVTDGPGRDTEETPNLTHARADFPEQTRVSGLTSAPSVQNASRPSRQAPAVDSTSRGQQSNPFGATISVDSADPPPRNGNPREHSADPPTRNGNRREQGSLASEKYPGIACSEYLIPVQIEEGGPKNYTIYGELCIPSHAQQQPETVQLLLHGGTYKNIYWDFPYQSEQYSYVRHAVPQGYATFNMDRIGDGRSSHPISTSVDLDSNAFIVHQIVQKLRTGEIGSRDGFDKIVLVGHSYGSFTSWVEAATYRDVDGAIITGALHTTSPIGAAMILGFLGTNPALQEPRFRHLDPGYVTTRPGARGPFFYNEEYADPKVIAYDEATKETSTETELLTFPPRQLDGITRAIDVPVLVVVGEKDFVWCGNGGLDCSTSEDIIAAEGNHYSPAACLEAFVLSNSGHDINLHPNNKEWYAASMEWMDKYFGDQAEECDEISDAGEAPPVGPIPPVPTGPQTLPDLCTLPDIPGLPPFPEFPCIASAVQGLLPNDASLASRESRDIAQQSASPAEAVVPGNPRRIGSVLEGSTLLE